MRKFLAFVFALATLSSVSALRAADHRDGPGVRADPAADINDVFAWMAPDANRVYLAMTVFPFAAAEARFSDSAQYVFHTASGPAFGQIAAEEVNLICTFNVAQEITCHIGDVTVSGDAHDPAGLASADGRLRVFAGLRNDPFFFNLNGFQRTARIVAGATGLIPDDAGCPNVDQATSQMLVQQLMTEPDGSPATDEFAGANTLAIVASVDKSLLTANGAILAVWASTNRASSTACAGDLNGDGDVRIDELVLSVSNALSGCTSATAPPLLGLQVERMGRAGINTAVVDPFFANEEDHGVVQNAYNASADPTQWASQFAARMAGNLAILDSLDAVCGNQLLAGPQPVAGRYDALAGVLADDRLYVNTASGTCQQYLAVEGNAVGSTNNDCGGRTPLYDTIDVSYSVLAIGQLTGVGDAIASDSDGTASLSAFPFLVDPVGSGS